MKNKQDLESYLENGGNYQPNFGWSPINYSEAKTNLYDLINQDTKSQAAKDTFKYFSKKNEVKQFITESKFG